jgi:hypothetical protein
MAAKSREKLLRSISHRMAAVDEELNKRQKYYRAIKEKRSSGSELQKFIFSLVMLMSPSGWFFMLVPQWAFSSGSMKQYPLGSLLLMDLWLPVVYMSILAQSLLASLPHPIPAHQQAVKTNAPGLKGVSPDGCYDLLEWFLVIMLYMYPKVNILISWRQIMLIILHALGLPFLCIIRKNFREWEDHDQSTAVIARLINGYVVPGLIVSCAGFITLAWACIRRDTVFGWKDFSVHSLADSFFVLVFGGISLAFAATWHASFPLQPEGHDARTLNRSATSSTGELPEPKGFCRSCDKLGVRQQK